jgi:hypothetical protein
MIVPAYRPSQAVQDACYTCGTHCQRDMAICTALAMAPLAACVFPPACAVAAAVAGGALAACDTKLLACQAICNLDDCCPKRCGPGNPLDGGDGCCDADEQCVAIGDPNSRQGCCPSGQAVCGGSCCKPGEHCCGPNCCKPTDRCCGDTCCPPDMFCVDNVCTYPSFGPWHPTPATYHPPISATGSCPSGYFACHGQCCQTGQTCCGYGCEWGHCIN